MTGRIVVTGATGFIGRHLCTSLASKGNNVVAITRRRNQALEQGIEFAVVDDLLDRPAIRGAVANATAVVHLAARVHAKPEGHGDPNSECHRVNVDGTVALLEESIAAGVKTFVYISSVKAVAGVSDSILTAATPPAPVDAYGVSKLEAERRVRAMATAVGIAAPILRLPNVYGPGMKANMSLLFWAVNRGLPLPLGLIRNRRSFAYVGNAVEGIERLLASPAAAHGTFYVSDGEDLSSPQLVRKVAAALGSPLRLLPVPPAAFAAAFKIGGLLSRIAPFHLTGDSLSAVLGSLFVDSSSLRDTTGFNAPFSVDKGMSLTAEWYKATAGAGR